jgi:uncharacterized DUF497 family protein
MLEKHGVTLEEALGAVETAPQYRRTRSGPGGEPRYYVAGKTLDRRRLWVIFEDEGGGVGRIVTAREPSGVDERARHRRMRGN